MGDQIEITTYPEEQSLFYNVPFGGFKVDIKANFGSAAIGLSKKLEDDCEYWVIIGQNRRTWIKKDNGPPGLIVQTPNILNANEYKSFWVSWHGLSIKFGREGESEPIVTFQDTNLKTLRYVTFAVNGSDRDYVVHWRFELPPVITKPDMLPITGGEVQWVRADNQLPDGAVIGGYENDALYIIRSEHNGSLTPGKFVSSEGVGYISWGGVAQEKHDFEVLVGYNCTWVQTHESNIPVGAIVGGYSEISREKLYIGRAYQNEHLIPGKVQPSHSVCYIAYDGSEVGHKRYEILVGPDVNARSANRTYKCHMDIDTPSIYDDFLEELVPL
ncbi:uncharacterized protein LOC131843495 [Achroia grisella]|uniref:uncharacterized protein LOC131843495 n=1 Tax=Achroia grisella TaxID=688607 RepID=UPI0027D23F3E|nr:uncharacterized protein LOC131843495 [Achroia grisella]